MNQTTARRRTYQLGAREPRILLGLGAPELAVLAAGLALALTAVNADKTLLGFSVALTLALGAAMMAWVPIAGRSTAQWTVVALRWIVMRLTGAIAWRHAGTTTGTTALGTLHDVVDVPGELGRLELVEAALFEGDDAGPRVGVLADRKGGTYTAALLVRADQNFGLQSTAAQEGDLAEWGQLLATLARDRSPLRRLAWIERTLPEPSDGLLEDLVAHKSPQLDWSDPAVASYLELVQSAGRQTDEHELLIVAQVSAAAARRVGRRRGWTGEHASVRVLMDELRAIADELDHTGMEVRRPLSARGLSVAVRTGLDPWSRATLERLLPTTDAAVGTRAAQDVEAQMSPAARQEHWDRIVYDGSQHAVLWVSDWPTTRKSAAFLAPLLLGGDVTRTVAVVMELLGPRRGMREVESQVSSNESAEDLRVEHGKRTTRRMRKRAQADARREDELSEGQVDVRFAGYIGVSAPGTDPNVLQASVDLVTRRAATCGLTVQRMWGMQAQGMTFLLPTGRGLK